MDDLLNQHTRLTDELAQRLRELGDTRAAITRTQAQAWQATTHLSITERREHVRHSTYSLTADVEVQLGEIEALRAELHNLELRIQHRNA